MKSVFIIVKKQFTDVNEIGYTLINLTGNEFENYKECLTEYNLLDNSSNLYFISPLQTNF